VLGPKGIASAATWADGISGFSFGANPKEIAQTCQLARDAWRQAQRTTPPRMISSFWYALNETGSRQQIDTHLRRYLNWLPAKEVEAMLPHTGFVGSAGQLRQRMAAIADTGVDELLLVPTSIDPTEVDRIADLIA